MLPISSIHQSPTAPDFLEDPYAFYSKARAQGDFVFWEEYQMAMATSYEAVKAVLTHPAIGREIPASTRAARPRHLSAFHKIDDHSLLRLEDPEHARLRKLAMNALRDEVILPMAPMISQTCDGLINEFPQDAPFDLLEAFADKVPGITLMRLLGFDDNMYGPIQTWARGIDGLLQANRNRALEDTAEQSATAFTGFMSKHLARLRKGGGTDNFIGRIVESQSTLADEEIMAMVLLVVQAGTGATAYAIGNALHLLAAYPERTLALTAEQIAATVDECLRFEPPLHILQRHAHDDVTVLGVSFPRDTQIGCIMGSASHDDAVWPDGNKFDPFRIVRPHLGFGTGIHACIGKSMTHMIMKIALPALFSRCPNLRVITPPNVANNYGFRRFETLEVML